MFCSMVKFWALNAGHALGAAIFMIKIAGHTVLYTGDYSMEDDGASLWLLKYPTILSLLSLFARLLMVCKYMQVERNVK